jgi:hypothetical protein
MLALDGELRVARPVEVALDDVPDEVDVGVDGQEVSAAPQTQRLVDRGLQDVVSLLDDAVLVGLPWLDPRGFQTEVLEHPTEALGQRPTAGPLKLVGRRGEVVHPESLRHPAEPTERVL